MSTVDDPITRAEREDLAKLVRRREKLAKADADRVAAERLAGLEEEFARDYRIGDEEVWREAATIVDEAAAEANARVALRCRELGIREAFAPSIGVHWYSRGENASKDRVAELRKVAKTRIDADAKRAKFEIERASGDELGLHVDGRLRTAEAL